MMITCYVKRNKCANHAALLCDLLASLVVAPDRRQPLTDKPVANRRGPLDIPGKADFHRGRYIITGSLTLQSLELIDRPVELALIGRLVAEESVGVPAGQGVSPARYMVARSLSR